MTKACALDYARELRRSLDLEKPGWVRELVRCPHHGGYHELLPADGQLFSVATDGQDSGAERRPLVRFRLLPGGLSCFHESKADVLAAPCAHCGAMLHAHKDALGRVKSGRQRGDRAEAKSEVPVGRGYLEERCPACHRANAVFPAHGLGGIRTAQLAEGAPAMQMKFSP